VGERGVGFLSRARREKTNTQGQSGREMNPRPYAPVRRERWQCVPFRTEAALLAD
jgi:hypothetical protein